MRFTRRIAIASLTLSILGFWQITCSVDPRFAEIQKFEKLNSWRSWRLGGSYHVRVMTYKIICS